MQIAESGINARDIVAAAEKQKKEISGQYDRMESVLISWLDETQQVLDIQVMVCLSISKCT